MTNNKVSEHATRVQVISGLAMCPPVHIPSGIWGITELFCVSMTATGSFIIDFFIASAKKEIYSVVNVAIAIYIFIVIFIDISILLSISIHMHISNSIAIPTTIDILVSTDTSLHLW